ncbi:MAG TPA: response regulator [Candidatus Nanopelagicales bacterium]|nr:response regulator [Candidatus Nanopelagicales bacterium]
MSSEMVPQRIHSPSAPPMSLATRLTSMPPRVLLAEDDVELRRLLVTALRRSGYRVTEVRDGEELMEILHDLMIDRDGFRPDLIATDIRMPKRSGLEVVTALRKFEQKTPVVLFTAFADDDTRDAAYRAGANLLLEKPFDIDDLTLAVRTLLL